MIKPLHIYENIFSNKAITNDRWHTDNAVKNFETQNWNGRIIFAMSNSNNHKYKKKYTIKQRVSSDG